ncbi:response regulator [Undibacterium sp. Di24W]|uniref:response regulator n=1 Tax=Undibacterium sp. Di24W TaxID=3413033 RepID=UPI003BF0C4AD
MANFTMGNRFFITQALTIGLAYFFLASISIHFSKEAGNVAQFWYANALGIAFLLQFQGQQKWLLTFILVGANLFANRYMGNSWELSMAFAIPNVIEMLVAPWLAIRLKIQLDFDQSPDTVLRFVLAVCLLPSGIGALIGAYILMLLNFAPFSVVLPTWFVSSSIGTLSLLPFLLLLKRRTVLTNSERLNLKTKRTFFFYAICVLLLSFFALRYLPFPFIYLVIPLVFAAIYTESLVVSGLVFIQSLVIAVMLHLGYFQKAFDSSNVLSFLSYLPILVTFIPVLVLMGSMNLFRRRDKQRLETEAALQRKHLELQMIVNNVPAMIGFWDLDLKNRFANSTYLDYFGWKPEDMLGVHMREIVGDTVYEKNLPHMQAALRGEPQVFERTLVNPNGLTREGLASYVPSYRDGKIEGVYVFVSDISDIKKAQRAEHIAQERLQAIIDSATEFSIIATDLQGTITLFSAGAEKLLGYAAAEMEHKVTPALIHVPEEAIKRSEELSVEFGRPVTGFDVFVLKATLGTTEKREWTYVHKSGKKIPVRLVVTAVFDLDRKIVGFLGIANDISDEKELQRLLIRAKDDAEQTSRAKSDFVANMSHEIRTPMNAVLGMSQLLASTDLSSEQRKYLEMIKVSGQSLMGILNDILDFSKIEANRLELSNTEFVLDEVLGALASMMAISVGEKDVEVAIGMGTDVPKRLIGDQLRLQQILTNLTSNALKFTEKGEVAVFVDAVKDSADLETNRVLLKITVSDTGIGMDKQQLQKLFQPFSQADASTTRKFGGTGLGLSISNSIATLMGGTIEVKSRLGTGSEFQISVPMIAINDTATLVSSTNKKRLSLLVVDDNSTSNNYICKTVHSWNWDTESATNGQQALDIARAKLSEGKHFDAIIVDWQMPMMDGLVTIKRLRELLPKGKTPLVIMVSAFSRDRLLQEQAADYADAILMKPITGSSIFDTVHEAIMLCSGVEVMPRYSKAAITRSNQIQGASLLLVEDNPFNQIVARGFLEQGGATVDVLENGYLAVEHLRIHAEKYHAVLMDVQMPIMDGISATRMIRNELHLHIPVIAMTAGVMYSERERCLQSGMNDFIAKPIDVEQMFLAISKVLPVGLLDNKTESGSSAKGTLNLDQGDADQSNTDQAKDESGIFDPRSLEMLGKSDPRNMQKILTSVGAVVENASEQIRQVRAAFDEARFDDAARILHTMRGSVGTLGARNFAELSLKTELEIRDGDKKNIDHLLLTAEDALQKTINAARHWLERKKNVDLTEQGTVLPKLEGQELIHKLRVQLQSNDIAACDVFPLVKENLSQKIPAVSISQLEAYINGLDFKNAKLLLDKFSL